MVCKETMQALLKLVEDCSVVIPIPSRKYAISKSLALYKMCTHAPCCQFLRTYDGYSVLGTLRVSADDTIAKYASAILKKLFNCDDGGRSRTLS
ncbi:putative non-specific serine/threonine protein kinase [Helianthus debilis subsp. tardiflorus]